MPPRKKSDASSQSSSGSSSGSSSSSSGSSSDSGTDSDSSSSSQELAKTDNHSTKSNSIDPKLCEKSTKKVPETLKPQPIQQKNKVENDKQKHTKPSSLSSTEDEESQQETAKTSTKKKISSAVDKKKPNNVLPKQQKSTDYSIPTTHLSGAKLPPSVIKQQQKEQAMKNKPNQILNALTLEGTVVNKTSTGLKSKKPSSVAKIKKKSIFSPENTSESDDEEKLVPKLGRRMSSSSNGVRGRGRPRKYPIVVQNQTSSVIVKCKSETKPLTTPEKLKKEIKEELSTTTTTSSSTSSSSSDSESSTNPSPSKKSPKNSKSIKENGTDSDIEDTKPSRKSSRMSTNRKSKHLIGTKSETESDVDSIKRSHSKSPVKKAQGVPTKAKTNHNVKKPESKSLSAEDTAPVQRICPLNDCDSVGHLSGLYEKHFTIDACPNYHNVLTVSETKKLLIDRTKREEDRKSAVLSMAEATTKKKEKFIATPEHRAYQQKIRDIRVKFKPNVILACDKTIKEKHKTTLNKEPNLEGLVSDYDLQLFKDAQAIASENIEIELKRLPASKGTKYVTMGKFNMEVWYQSVYPDDLARLPKLYLCEFCLRYQKSEVGMKRHSEKCVWKHPPGDEIYRKAKLCVWQVDGKKHKQYCQHLCLLAKFFLDHKTLYYDVEPFLFYIMTIADSDGCHVVGYFSKEKNSFLNYNVSCILTLPPYQRKGFGRLLIDFSYLLTRVECKIGSPEKPLSDLGLISYRSYWKDVLLAYLCSRSGSTLSVKDISQEMAINSYDIVSTLQALGMMKYWKGKHIILKKQDVLEEYEERNKKLNLIKIDPSCLKWTPFVPPQQTQQQVASKSQPS